MFSVSTLVLLYLAAPGASTNAYTLPLHQTTPTTTSLAQFDPTKPLTPIHYGQVKRSGHCVTNAECLRQRLPLRPAQTKRAHKALAPRQSACTPSTFSGAIQIVRLSDSSDQGYIQPLNGDTLYYASPDLTTAATFSFATCLDSNGQSNAPFNIDVAQAPSGYPFFSFAAGYANIEPVNDLSPATFNYLWGTNSIAQTAVFSGPQQIDNLATGEGSNLYIESAVWRFNSNTGRLTVNWVNTDDTTVVGPLSHTLYDGYYVASTANLTAFDEVAGGSGEEVGLFLTI